MKRALAAVLAACALVACGDNDGSALGSGSSAEAESESPWDKAFTDAHRSCVALPNTKAKIIVSTMVEYSKAESNLDWVSWEDAQTICQSKCGKTYHLATFEELKQFKADQNGDVGISEKFTLGNGAVLGDTDTPDFWVPASKSGALQYCDLDPDQQFDDVPNVQPSSQAEGLKDHHVACMPGSK